MNVLVGIFLALAYLAYLVFAIPVGVLAGLLAWAVAIPATYLISLWRVLVVRPPGLPGARRRPKLPADADPAVPQYFYGPARADAEHAIRVAYDGYRELWRRGIRAVARSFDPERRVFISAPLGAGAVVGIALGTAIGVAAAAGCLLVYLLAIGVCVVAVRATGTVLRAADSAVLRVRNIRMVCPNCYRRVPYPAYECPGRGCDRRHRDVRPGPFGIIRRRCQCGARLQTLLLFGSARMDACCPDCGYSLEHGPGKAPEIVLPFFGAAGAGKTRLLFSMVVQLQMWSGENFAVELADSTTARKLASAAALLSPAAATDKTPPELPQAYIIRLSSRNGTRILHMFDAAGELFYTPEHTQELRYLDKATTFVLVIDPLSVEAFWDRLLPETQAGLTAVRSAAPAPDLAYQQAHQEIEAMGVQLGKTRLAVVFSRADLIEAPGEDVAAWARDELGLGNLVRSARLNFAEARFFRTAAVMDAGTMHESIPALIRWVLGQME